jgi:hypothetical protein
MAVHSIKGKTVFIASGAKNLGGLIIRDDRDDVVPCIRHLVSDGFRITGQTILINGSYIIK